MEFKHAFRTTSEERRVSELEFMKQSLEKQLAEMAKTVEEQQRQIAMSGRDQLTGLRNRQGVAEQINTILQKDREGTFFIMDMDNFKEVNDTYGHLEGDKCLVRFANALRDVMDSNDIVARIGGDEFIIFTPGDKSMDEIREKAGHILRHVGKKLVSPGKLVRVTVSMGIAIAPKDGLTYEALYKHSDEALYAVKNTGKNSFCVYRDIQRLQDKYYGTPKSTLAQITTSIRESKMEGSFVVEYDSFEKIYRFLERNISRENREIQCVLFTLEDDESKEYDKLEIQRQMEHLQHAVTSMLRRGDVTTVYSASQILVLLMDINNFNAVNVVERIMDRFQSENKLNPMKVSYEIQKLIPEEITRDMVAARA